MKIILLVWPWDSDAEFEFATCTHSAVLRTKNKETEGVTLANRYPFIQQMPNLNFKKLSVNGASKKTKPSSK